MPFVHSKTTLVRPLCESKENGTLCQSFAMPVQQKKLAEITHLDGFSDKLEANAYSIDGTKENYLDVCNSVHSKFSADVEEIRKWKISIELESKHKNKKEEELSQTIDSQRKMMLDLQLQNENLSIQLNEEIQKRTLVIEKLHSTKELCSALKKHYNTLQGHYEYGNRIEELINVTDTKRLKAVENLKDKFEKISIEYSENIGYLKNALIAEENKVLDLKDVFEEKLAESKNENDSLCVMLQTSRNEVERLTKELEDERNKFKSLLEERKNLQSNAQQLEQSNEELLCQLRDTENTLRLVESNKIEIEKRYLSENVEIKDLKKKYEECLEAAKYFKMESEETAIHLKQTIENLENKVFDMEKKIKEEQIRYGTLVQSLQDIEIQKNDLEVVVSSAKDDLAAYETLKNDFAALEEKMSQLLEDNKYLNVTLETNNEELLKCNSEKESITIIFNQKIEELSKLMEKQKILEDSKETELVNLKENISELLLKVKTLEEDLESKAEQINAKEDKMSNLLSVLDEKERVFETLNYENIVMKDKIESENSSVKICMECEELKAKLEDVQNLKNVLNKTEEELKKQKRENVELWKILDDTETRYNNNRIMKEKELIGYQDQVRKLEDKLSLLEMDVENLSAFKSKNTNLKKEIEDLKSKILTQEDLSPLKSKNACLNEEIDKLNLKLNTSAQDLKKLKSENRNLKENGKKLTLANEDLKILTSENLNLKENIEKLKILTEKDINALKSENISLKEEIEKLNKSEKCMESENISLREEIEKLNNSEKCMESENISLREEIEKLNNSEKDIIALKSENISLKDEIEKLNNSEKDMESQNISLRDEIEKLNNSAQKDVQPGKKKNKRINPSLKVNDTFPRTKSTEPVVFIKKGNNEEKKSVRENESEFTIPETKKIGKMSQDTNNAIFNKNGISSESTKNLERISKRVHKSTVYEKWETNSSSGSDVYELVFDKGSDKIKELTSKRSNIDAKQLNQIPKTSPFFKGNQKRISNENELRKIGIFNKKQKTEFENNSQKNFDFLSKEDIKKDNRKDSLWFQLKNAPPHPSPSVSTPRKFFKTPLVNRDNAFKKPQGGTSPWF